MGVEDIIGVNNGGTSNSTNSTESTALPILIQPDAAVLIYGIWASSQLAVALTMYIIYNSKFSAPVGTTSKTLYTWVWLSGFIGVMAAWLPPSLFWPMTIFFRNHSVDAIFLYSSLLSLDGPAIFYFIPMILLLYCNTKGTRSGLIIASKT